MNLKKKIYVFGAVAVLLAGCGRQETTYLEAVQQEETEEKVTETDMCEDVGLCYVYVCGAVKEPGVYSLPAGSHIFEAVEMAGGMTEDAAAEAVNQAELIADGQMIKIYTPDEMEEKASEEAAVSALKEQSVQQDGRVNINTATAEILMTLPGVGQQKAESIVSYREENGAFHSRAELKKVPKLGPKAFEQCAGFLRVQESANVLDHTAVHPESYPAASALLTLCGYDSKHLARFSRLDIAKKQPNFVACKRKILDMSCADFLGCMRD